MFWLGPSSGPDPRPGRGELDRRWPRLGVLGGAWSDQTRLESHQSCYGCNGPAASVQAVGTLVVNLLVAIERVISAQNAVAGG